MLLNLFIKIHKYKLENMIKKNTSYDRILAQSQKLDKYIAKKYSRILMKKGKCHRG